MSSGGEPGFGSGGFFGGSAGGSPAGGGGGPLGMGGLPGLGSIFGSGNMGQQIAPRGPYGAWPFCGFSSCLIVWAGIILVFGGLMRMIGQ